MHMFGDSAAYTVVCNGTPCVWDPIYTYQRTAVQNLLHQQGSITHIELCQGPQQTGPVMQSVGRSMIYWDFASKLQVFAKLRLLWREAVAVAKDHTTDLADGFRMSEVNLQKKGHQQAENISKMGKCIREIRNSSLEESAMVRLSMNQRVASVVFWISKCHESQIYECHGSSVIDILLQEFQTMMAGKAGCTFA